MMMVRTRPRMDRAQPITEMILRGRMWATSWINVQQRVKTWQYVWATSWRNEQQRVNMAVCRACNRLEKRKTKGKNMTKLYKGHWLTTCQIGLRFRSSRIVEMLDLHGNKHEHKYLAKFGRAFDNIFVSQVI
jgi:hypothetical protein